MGITPMMSQYRAVKEKYSDCMVLFRLGDFYEMFFEDAVEGSKILGIALTARNKGDGMKAPMCGVPFHAVDGYIAKLTRAGRKVAVCDQMTEPDGRGIVEREVVRVVTPGTTFDDNILDKKSNNYVACLVQNFDGYGFAYS
ncbi:MAG TPA: DNA mismatch repair protein MutS, partial [Candidatus Gracilibacteria bacterium]|nr:DNA mismatch repair protein MutS [Candidatus Gracilibacteria bacterium]